MARKRQIMFSNNVTIDKETTNEANNEENNEERSELRNAISKNLKSKIPELVGVFGNNYKEEMQKVFNELRNSVNCVILEDIDAEMCTSGNNIYFVISAVLLDFLSNISMDELQRRSYLIELERVSAATRKLPTYGSGYSTHEMLMATMEKMDVAKRMKSLLNRITIDFHKKIVIPIDFGFSEINYDIIRRLNEIKTCDVIFVIGSFRDINSVLTSFNYIEQPKGGVTFSYYFASKNIISAE